MLRIASDALDQGDVERAKRLADGAFDADRPLALHILGRVAFAEKDIRAGRTPHPRVCRRGGSRRQDLVSRRHARRARPRVLLALGELETARQFFPEGLELLQVRA